MSSFARRIIVAAAVSGSLAAAAHAQSSSPACEELRKLAETKSDVAQSLADSETMAQTLQELAKTKAEEIEACKSAPGQRSCAAAELAVKRDEVRRVMAQVRELRAARATVEAALKEIEVRVREMADKLKDGCPDAKR